jgi:hypothetical protein
VSSSDAPGRSERPLEHGCHSERIQSPVGTDLPREPSVDNGASRAFPSSTAGRSYTGGRPHHILLARRLSPLAVPEDAGPDVRPNRSPSRTLRPTASHLSAVRTGCSDAEPAWRSHHKPSAGAHHVRGRDGRKQRSDLGVAGGHSSGSAQTSGAWAHPGGLECNRHKERELYHSARLGRCSCAHILRSFPSWKGRLRDRAELLRPPLDNLEPGWGTNVLLPAQVILVGSESSPRG